MLNALYHHAVQLLYPSHCSACDEACPNGAAFCRICFITLLPVGAACARCALPTPHRLARCLGCQARAPSFAATWAPFEFGGALATAIRRLKWSTRPDLARSLAQLVPSAILVEALAEHDLVVPVPLHPRRLRQREYNQAALLALSLGRPSQLGTGRPVDLGALHRLRDTASQSLLRPAERRDNVKDAFSADPRRVRGRRVLLIDDVMTTGATADACAAALREAGAASVGVLTVARAVP